MIPRQLREPVDQVVLTAPLGMLFRDSFDGRVVADGLQVELREGTAGRWQALQPNGQGVFVAHGLRRMRVPPDPASPATRRFEVRLRDLRQRFQPLRLQADLPTEGLYDPALPGASPPQRLPAVPLYSAATRGLPGGIGVVRACLRRAADPQQAAPWARVELWLDGQRIGEGVADGAGALLLPCALPPPREPPLHGSPPAAAAGFERNRWDVELRAFWSPAMRADQPPDLHALQDQPEVPLLRDPGSPPAPLGPQVLRPQEPLVARSDASSYLFVGA